MSFCRKYHDDMYINGIYLKKYIKTQGGNTPNKGEFICPLCGKSFITRITSISSGNTTNCGCKNKDNLIGQKFGKLTVIKKAPNKNNRTAWYCKCDCGNPELIIVQGKLLKNGSVKSCGCLKQQASHIKDLTGYRFGYLTVLKDSGQREQKYVGQSNVLWDCLCDCGKHILVNGQMLQNGKVYSCGCKKERSKGELKIKQILEENQIDFVEQYTYKDLINPKTGYKLRFDFFLPKYCVLIEYDGLQHELDYKPNSFYSVKELKELHYRDDLKTQYCYKNGIPLIRISDRNYFILSWKYLKEQIELSQQEVAYSDNI